MIILKNYTVFLSDLSDLPIVKNSIYVCFFWQMCQICFSWKTQITKRIITVAKELVFSRQETNLTSKATRQNKTIISWTFIFSYWLVGIVQLILWVPRCQCKAWGLRASIYTVTTGWKPEKQNCLVKHGLKEITKTLMWFRKYFPLCFFATTIDYLNRQKFLKSLFGFGEFSSLGHLTNFLHYIWIFVSFKLLYKVIPSLLFLLFEKKTATSFVNSFVKFE